jgi:hypothetical protein
MMQVYAWLQRQLPILKRSPCPVYSRQVEIIVSKATIRMLAAAADALQRSVIAWSAGSKAGPQ